MKQQDLVAALGTLGDQELKDVLDRVAQARQCVGAVLPRSGPGSGHGCGPDKAPGGGGKAPCPAMAFEVPGEVKHLDFIHLHDLTEAFRHWYESAKSPARKRARGRIWMLYLLIRYGALKLGEALAVDDRADFDFERACVIIRGDNDREVQLPREIANTLARLLDDPMNASLRGEVFRLDQGFVRRKFYERAQECGIPKDYINPRVVRHSRAVELLRGGLPLQVVQAILGHQSITLTAQYVAFSDDDVSRIVNHYILKERKMKTSARNAFTGKVSNIRKGQILFEVELTTPSGLKVVSTITHDSMDTLKLELGSPVTATVKAPWVILVKDDMKFKTSARNKYAGKIVRITEGQIAAEVVVELPDGTKVCALVTDESVKSLDLKVGDDICTLFKAFSVILNAE
ncbi:TOBE domain-containing protein [Fundidesulfovibrio agrisoli]|uniref:TOBE domain-containing protein n=1 Tax=Fundidesulfovibrio agrisoli TaxID=2922717 RepID=UPI001FAB4EA3|nr:TOBE domain-containing protein [Fundidesulfovibrio agrisoli]